jgi:hypothetical protein
VAISVDAAADSLDDVISRINAAGAGATASYDSGSDTLVFTPDVAGATLTLEHDTTGFLAATNVAEGAVGTQVNVDAAFDATGADGPLFDPGVSVQAGSFTVNGVAIAVGASDTVSTVLARITASAAGVTASFDAATQTVSLALNDGSAPIVVDGDTSGFLAAVKLDGSAQSTTGSRNVSALAGELAEMAEYGNVQAGTITINGSQIAVDPATTTIDGLVAALDAVAGISAGVDQVTGAITVGTEADGGTIVLADTSGLLAELGIAAGTYMGDAVTATVVQRQTATVNVTNAETVASKANDAVAQLNAALGQIGSEADSLQQAVDALDAAGLGGVSLVTEGDSARLSIDSGALAASLSRVGDTATLTAAVDKALADLSERTAAAVAARTAEQDAARQRLAREQAQGGLLTLAPIRPRAAAAAARIRTVEPAGRRAEPKPIAKLPTIDIRPLESPFTTARDPLQSLFDLFRDDGAGRL